MKFTIEGLSQSQLVAWGLDATDAVIIRWFSDFYHGSKMVSQMIEEKEYKWLRYQHVINELPICGIKDRDAIANRFKKYCRCGLMEIKVWRVCGVFTYFRISPEMWDALTSSSPVDKPVNNPVDNLPPSPIEMGKVPHENGEGPPSEWGTNNSSINSSINKINKREGVVDNSEPQNRLDLELFGESDAYKMIMGGKKT